MSADDALDKEAWDGDIYSTRYNFNMDKEMRVWVFCRYCGATYMAWLPRYSIPKCEYCGKPLNE